VTDGELIVEQRDRVAYLTLNRPERRNAATPELIDELIAALERIDSEPDVRVLVLTGAGTAFCAGFDITRIETSEGSAGISERLCARLASLRVPTIAMVNGMAAGTGCDLAVSCDLRYVSETARFQMPPVRLGVLYENGGMARLIQAVGPAAARDMLLTGGPIDAGRALQIGLAHRVVPAEALAEETERLAATITSNAPLSVAATKLALNHLARGPLAPEAEAAIADARRAVWASADSREGPRAFKEGRAPVFKGH
jgi:crotonobetainyl-CoA hydratase